MFTPIHTDRLILRGTRPDDIAALAARRNDEAVARYQNWDLPFPEDEARRIVEGSAAMAGPEPGEWWMGQVSLDGGEAIGDIAVRLSADANTAEIGYTLARAHWGNGYGREAVDAVVPYLFDTLGVTRIEASVHPDHWHSARVLELNGFLFEATTRSSSWIRGTVADDHIYSLLAGDRAAWRDRPRTRPDGIELVEVTTENDSAVYTLKTHKTEEAFVAPMKWTFADALIPEIINDAPVVPWMRAAYADGELVGFVMLALVTEHHPEPYLWRLLVDRLHQRRGIGSMILDQIEAWCLDQGWPTLTTSWGEGPGSPEPFYRGRGFEPTGRIVDDEVEARKHLA